MSYSPSRYNNQQLSESIIIQNQSRMDLRRRQIQETKHYQKLAVDSFPFGKQGIKLSQYVSNQLNSKQQQDNARILQEFRRKAIEDKFHNKYGHAKNSRLMQKYITQNMLPGVSVNPSIVGDLGTQLKNNSVGYEQSYRKPVQYTHQYTQPTYMSTNNQGQNLYNARRKKLSIPSLPQYQSYHTQNQYNSTISYQNPQKYTLNTQCQTQQIQSPQKSRFKQVNLQRKYYKLRLKTSQKQIQKFKRLQKMLYNLNDQIHQNSKVLQNIIVQNENKRNKNKRRQNRSLRQDNYDNEYERRNNMIKYEKPRIKTQVNENYMQKNWRLNNKILYNSTQSSFYNQANRHNEDNNKKNINKMRPKIKYTLKGQRNVQRLQRLQRQQRLERQQRLQRQQNCIYPEINKQKKKQRNNTYQSTRDYKLDNKQDQGNKSSGIDRIRNHLKLLKRHTDRLQTINSYSLVN